jgi:arabinogalactan oligomer / maltooligosaccharide transport system permease protein
MGKTFKLMYAISAMIFLGASICFFLEKNDFLGEVIDAKIVKTKMKNEPYFENSLFKTDSQGRSKFRRMDLSSLVSDKKLGKEVFKFEVIKHKKELVDKELRSSKIIFGAISIFMVIAAVIIIVFKRFYILLILEILSACMIIYYDKLLKTAVNNLGLEKKVYEMWGVAESIQHFAIFGLILFTITAFIITLIKKEKEDYRNVKDNIASMKKSIKINLHEIKKYKFAYYMLTPAIVVVILIIIYPFLYNFRISFSNLNLKRFISFIQGDKLYFTGMANFVEIFTDPSFWKVLGRTVIWTICNIVFHVLGGVTLAILLNRDMKMRPIYQTLLILPWAIPQFIAVLVWKGMYNSDYGAVNVILGRVVNSIDQGVVKSVIDAVPSLGKILKISIVDNIEVTSVVIPWLTDPIWAFTGAIITNIWLGIPFMMMIALGGLQSIPETFYEAAEIDGASAWQKIRHITIPQLKPVMTPAIIMGIVWTFNNLNVIYLLTTDSLTGKVDILVTFVYKAAFNLYRYGYAAAFSVIIFVILMVFSVIMIKTTKAEEGV